MELPRGRVCPAACAAGLFNYLCFPCLQAYDTKIELCGSAESIESARKMIEEKVTTVEI